MMTPKSANLYGLHVEVILQLPALSLIRTERGFRIVETMDLNAIPESESPQDPKEVQP